MTWRPQIPEGLEARIEEVVEPAGYQSKSELVRDAVRHQVEKLDETGESDERQEQRERETAKDLKEIALDRGRGKNERRSAVNRLGELGEVAIDQLSEVAKEASDSFSRKLSDDQREISGEDLRQRARKKIREISGSE